MTSKLYLSIALLFFLVHVNAASIILDTKDAVVWLPEQTISGKISGFNSDKIKWHLNNTSGYAEVAKDGSFNFSVLLKPKENIIWVEDVSSSKTSDTIHYTLGYTPLPEVIPFATIKNNIATLDLKITNNPYNSPLTFHWNSTKSPASVSIDHASNQKATVKIPSTNGEYFFSVTVYAGNDSVVYKTFVTRTDKGLQAFNIFTQHAQWIDSAIIYEITPYKFVHDGQYDDITKKLPEIKSLGINTIWLQPVYATHDGEQGYDIIDYFSLRPDLGTEEQLARLIKTAKNLNLRVMFDFVPNHTSIHHPYAKDVIEFGEKSHYYNFYQHTNDFAQYSSDYTFDSLGFVHYFWKNLVNLNYNNPEVQQYILEAMKYWLTKFDLDGYRLDAMWALNARDSSFGKRLQATLKSIKPDILLLAEDKGARRIVYKEGYDAAYDWRADTSWISSWSWATDYSRLHDPTIFNYNNPEKRSLLLNKALFSGDTNHLRFRFLENNDVQRFISEHGLKRTKMAAVLLFSLPGIPMIYDGQEIGFQRKPYTNISIFKSDQTIQSLDSDRLFTYYKQLTSLRLKYDALRSNHMQALPVTPATMYTLDRSANNQHIFVVINLGEDSATAKIDISSLQTSCCGNSYVDLLNGEIFHADENETYLNIPMGPYTTKLLLINESAIPLALDNEAASASCINDHSNANNKK